MTTDVYRISARVYWLGKELHQAAITVNGKVVSHCTTDEDEAGLSVLATIDPDKDIVEVVAYGSSQIRGPLKTPIFRETMTHDSSH